ncbi:putative Thioredoxin [Nannochloris sp. 'desiccata']|nr:putative Thioredoxin [Chlorella desiccata (nom. nud.)]
MASSSQNYAEGSVLELTMGSAELDSILASASSRQQLVLLDFSVSWCGPCRMLAPILVQLASENQGRVVVIKMDCEKTAANQALAASASISAYPTLKIYSRGQVVETLRGANPAALRQSITNHLAQLGPAVNHNLALSLAQALSKVKAGCSFDQFLVASKTLAAYVGNIVNNPTEPKYRKIKLSNQSFQSRLGRLPGGRECLLQIGFQERTEAMEPVLVLDHVPEQLKSVLHLLQQAISDAERTRMGGGGGGEVTVAPNNPPASSPAPAAPPVAPGPSNVHASQLARVLAESMNVAAGADGSQAAAPSSTPQRQQQQQQPRKVLITPGKLARALAKIMHEAGFGSTSG